MIIGKGKRTFQVNFAQMDNVIMPKLRVAPALHSLIIVEKIMQYLLELNNDSLQLYEDIIVFRNDNSAEKEKNISLCLEYKYLYKPSCK